MEKWLEESLELMPGRARGNWSLNESVAGAPGAFASSDGPEPTLDGQVAELLDMVRNPTWEYPKWALPKVALDEVKKKALTPAQKKQIQRAYELGKKTFEMGKPPTPFPPKVKAMIKGMKVGDEFGMLIMKAYQRGWWQANVDAPVPGMDEAVSPVGLDEEAKPRVPHMLRVAVLAHLEDKLQALGKKYGAKFSITGSSHGIEVKAWIDGSKDEAEDIARIFLGNVKVEPHTLKKDHWVAKAIYQLGDIF